MAGGSRQRVLDAFAHRQPDRTPLFETFQSYHPIHWPICGRTPATEAALAWDALAEGISHRELLELETKTQFAMAKHFGLDLVHIPAERAQPLPHPVKTGARRWRLSGLDYVVNERTQMVVAENPPQWHADSVKTDEEELVRRVEAWDGRAPAGRASECPESFRMLRDMADADGLDWCYLGEVGAGTGVAFYPPFQLMWFISDPERLRRWMEMSAAWGFEVTRQQISWGCEVVAMGGDVSCDKGPFCSPRHYHDFILPAIQEHVRVIHQAGALAVYTSDGNHWPIRDDFFFRSGIDGYKEVDKAAGMTMERLEEEGVAARVCIMGNIDARHALCLGTPELVRGEVRRCLEVGRKTPGGHILHTSHSVHEDVRPENYLAMVDEYRRTFGLPPLPG